MASESNQQIIFPLDPASIQILVKALQPYFGAALVAQIVAGVGISISPVTGLGTVTVTNGGVQSLIAGSGISISGSTGNITVSATTAGVTQIIAGTGISISPVGGTGAVTVSAASTALSHTSGTGIRNMTSATGTEVFAHGLGKTPLFVKFNYPYTGPSGMAGSGVGTMNGSSEYYSWAECSPGSNAGGNSGSGFTIVALDTAASNGQTGNVSFDGTNITINWTKVGTLIAGFVAFLWEAYG